ncbi:benzoate 4-monooxygenase cytochrome P450 [Colletotrichum simmondsii]|uniref:Benzoate 4-monooxygenase cytochrome P450 n=1 Tax=Colletotrichum simmondsii TaxID=703756 RepID=A0A135RRB3_9PEZI|nr:benzoate 4-monooxygenase cytochrome P450 [Colletotrichum simmondsii]
MELPQSINLTSILVSVFILTATFCFKCVIDSHRARLSDIPGPWIARYTNLYAVYLAWRTERGSSKVNILNDLRDTYGEVIRLGPRSVTVFDPFAVPVIYGIRSRLNKGEAYIPFRQSGVTTSLLSIQEETIHSRYRRLVSNAYSMTSLKAYEPYVDELISKFINVCENHAEKKQVLNLSRWCYNYCFDVVAKLSLGKPLGFLDGYDTYGLYDKVKRFGAYVAIVSQMPWLHKVVQENFVMRRSRPSPFLKVVSEIVNERVYQGKSDTRPDLLSYFVSTHEQQPQLMTTKQVAISASGNLIAGSLSPGKTFHEMCKYLASNPASQDKLYAELKEGGCGPFPTFDELQELPYLLGVVKEALRLHSSASFNLQRVTSSAGLRLPNGVFIPGHTNIGCPASQINRDRHVFGQDADVYIPERWMKRTAETNEEYLERKGFMEKTELTFGQGSRTCIGKNIFALEVYKVVATLVSLYKFEKVGGSGGEVTVKLSRRVQ